MKNIITYDFGLSKTPGAKLKKFLDSFSKCTLAIFFFYQYISANLIGLIVFSTMRLCWG